MYIFFNNVIILAYGDALVSTEIFEFKMQVGGTRYVQKAINANKFKSAVASLFNTKSVGTVAFA